MIERTREELTSTFNTLSRTLHAALGRDIPSNLEGPSRVETLRLLTLIDRRFRGFRFALSPIEQTEYAKLMSPMEVARHALADEKQREAIVAERPEFLTMTPEAQVVRTLRRCVML